MTRTTVLALALAFGMAGCADGDVDDAEGIPETAEVEGVDADDPAGERLELDEETVLGQDDIGEEITAAGWVEGMPLPNGFFLRTAADRVIFVESDQTEQSVQAGETVRVMGPLAGTEVAVFEGWESDAFETGFDAEWDVETITYIDAYSIMPADGSTMDAGTVEGGQTQP